MKKMKQMRHMSLRIDDELLKKFDYVAKYDERSMNWMLLQLIRKSVAEFEETHGPIQTGDDEA